MKNFLVSFTVFVVAVFSAWKTPLAQEKNAKPLHPEIAESAEEIVPLAVGIPIPPAKVQDLKGKESGLREILAGRPALLIFYRGGWCPFCNTQLEQLASIQDSLFKKGVSIFALSTDKPEKLRETLEKQSLDYTLLSDSRMEAAKAFGIAFRVETETVSRLKGHGMDIEAASGQTHHLLPVPSVFLTDSKGVIRFVYSNPDYRVRIDSDSLFKAIEENLR